VHFLFLGYEKNCIAAFGACPFGLHRAWEPYYRVKDFRLFEGASAEIYSAYAEVDFFIYKDIAMHEKRKYRYDAASRHWDRYLKTLLFGKDSVQ